MIPPLEGGTRRVAANQALAAAGLVPSRACGECTVCCRELTIDTPELKKVQGVSCVHCLPGKGCALHPDWPPICRTWFCEWRRLEWLDDSWRPDRSKLLIRATDDDVPAGFASRVGVVFDVLGPCTILLQPHVIEVIARLMVHGMAVFLSVPGLPGQATGRVFLNPLLDAALRERDGDALARGLVDAFLRSVLAVREAIVLG